MTSLRKKLSPHAFTAAAALALFLLLLGSKWWVFDRYGSDLPNWDQWDAEGSELLAPWFEHDHFLTHLFTPHNEHRVVMTKLSNLALTVAAGQWDARLECLFNAALHSAIAAACWLAGRRWIGQALGGVSPALLQTGWFVAIALLFGLPIAWQNITGGFHSQQYWLLGLSFAAMVALPFARPWSAVWWAAAVAAGLALLTMGSGFLASVLIFAAVAWRCWRGDATLRETWPTLALTAALVAAGALTRVEVSYHQHMKAKSAHDFIYSLMHSFQWPVPRGDAWWAALVLWVPWVVVAWRALRERAAVARVAQPIAMLGGWVVLQLLATAYARGANGDFPAPRYMDTLAFGMVANALALAWILTGAVSRAASALRAALAFAWLGVFAWGLWEVTPLATVDGLPDNKRYFTKAEMYVKAYLVTHDKADLAHDDIPYPGADSLIERLMRPSLHPLMPVSIRPPLPLKAAASVLRADTPAVASRPALGADTPATTGQAFLENDASLRSLDDHPPRRGFSPATAPLPSQKTWGSFGAGGLRGTGEWRSAPVTAELGGWLKFETAGNLGGDGVALELRDAKSDALLATVRPTRPAGDAWRAAYVRAPRGPFVVVARDTSPDRWLAFSAPIEMSNLSHFAWVLVKSGRLLTFVAAGACLLLGLVAFYRHVLFPELPRRLSPG